MFSAVAVEIFKAHAVTAATAYGLRMNISSLTTPQRVTAVSILVIALAAFLPWVSIFGVSVSGIQGDGVMTLGLAVAGGILLGLTTDLFGRGKSDGRKSQIAMLVLAVLVSLIGFMDMNGAAAMGLYLTLFAGIAWVVGAAWHLNISKNSSGASTDEAAA